MRTTSQVMNGDGYSWPVGCLGLCLSTLHSCRFGSGERKTMIHIVMKTTLGDTNEHTR